MTDVEEKPITKIGIRKIPTLGKRTVAIGGEVEGEVG